MSELVDLTVYLLRETEAAVLVSETGGDDDAVWLPKSQIGIFELKGERGKKVVEVTLPAWLAENEGLW